MKIIITVPDYTREEKVADYVALVADQVREGYTSGHVAVDHHWTREL